MCILTIAVVSGKVGISSLHNWHGPAGSLTNDLFIPAIMMNAGHGFSNIDPTTVPELRTFLDFQQPAFNIQNIPENIESVPLHPYQEFHRYLIYSVALIWRIQGVTWDAVKTLLLIYLFLTCLGVYGICRLAMHPLLALLTVIAFSSLTGRSQPHSPILRDFAKAPFILGTAYFLACIVFKENTRAKFFVKVLLVGLLLGLGMGFRRDVMIFLPISIIFLFFGAIKGSHYAIGTKIISVLMLITVFVVSGWPVHKSLMRSGFLAAHDTIMGFSSFSDHELKLVQPASYEKHYLP